MLGTFRFPPTPQLLDYHQRGASEFKALSCNKCGKCNSVTGRQFLTVPDKPACPIQPVPSDVQFVQSQVIYRVSRSHGLLGAVPGFEIISPVMES